MEKLFKTLIQPDSILKFRNHFVPTVISIPDNQPAKFLVVAFESTVFVHTFSTSVN